MHLHSSTVKKYMYYFYKPIHYLTFDRGVKITRNVTQYPLNHVTYAPAKFEVATSNRFVCLFVWFLCPGHTFTDHLAGSTTDQIPRMTPEMTISVVRYGCTKQSTTTYDYGCNTEKLLLIRIATDDAGSYPWLILRQIRECVT